MTATISLTPIIITAIICITMIILYSMARKDSKKKHQGQRHLERTKAAELKGMKGGSTINE